MLIVHTFNLPKDILRQFENGYKKIEEEGLERVFLTISNIEDMKKISNNKSENPRDMLLDLLIPNFKEEQIKEKFQGRKEQIKEKFQGREDLLDLILIVRLGLFGKFRKIDEYLQNGFLNKTLDEIEKEDNFLKFDEDFAKSEKNILFEVIEDTRYKNKEFIFEKNQQNDELFDKLPSLIGDRESGYQVNEEIYNSLIISSGCLKYDFFMAFYDEESQQEIFYIDCLTAQYVIRIIKIILVRIMNFVNLSDKKNIFWRIVIKKIFEAFELLNAITLENEKTKEDEEHQEQ